MESLNEHTSTTMLSFEAAICFAKIMNTRLRLDNALNAFVITGSTALAYSIPDLHSCFWDERSDIDVIMIIDNKSSKKQVKMWSDILFAQFWRFMCLQNVTSRKDQCTIVVVISNPVRLKLLYRCRKIVDIHMCFQDSPENQLITNSMIHHNSVTVMNLEYLIKKMQERDQWERNVNMFKTSPKLYQRHRTMLNIATKNNHTNRTFANIVHYQPGIVPLSRCFPSVHF